VVLYLLFNEGYLSAQSDRTVRRELCDEAIRLTTLLTEHPVGATPETFALLALMHFHGARLTARLDGMGGLLLLEEQDRSCGIRTKCVWVRSGCRGRPAERPSRAFMRKPASRPNMPSRPRSRNPLERNRRPLRHADRIAPSPLKHDEPRRRHSRVARPEAGLALLKAIEPPQWLLGYYLWDAVLGELHRRAGHNEEARRYIERALPSAPTDAEQELLRRRLASLESL